MKPTIGNTGIDRSLPPAVILGALFKFGYRPFKSNFEQCGSFMQGIFQFRLPDEGFYSIGLSYFPS